MTTSRCRCSRPWTSWSRLTAANVPHRFVHYPDRGHMGITDDVIREARAFITEMEPKK